MIRELNMAQMMIDDKRLKDVLKEAMLELLQERKDIFQEAFAEVLEEYALVRAIDEGLTTEKVSRDEVFAVLEKVG
jgi:Asp-tRNA(Asn)/Glu-tRNA(Gln) amidotransferase C subunit